MGGSVSASWWESGWVQGGKMQKRVEATLRPARIPTSNCQNSVIKTTHVLWPLIQNAISPTLNSCWDFPRSPLIWWIHLFYRYVIFLTTVWAKIYTVSFITEKSTISKEIPVTAILSAGWWLDFLFCSLTFSLSLYLSSFWVKIINSGTILCLYVLLENIWILIYPVKGFAFA